MYRGNKTFQRILKINYKIFKTIYSEWNIIDSFGTNILFPAPIHIQGSQTRSP